VIIGHDAGSTQGESASWISSGPDAGHEDAIYLHESAQFHVDRLDWTSARHTSRRVDVDHYTQAELA